jgi:hypothetical protein
MSDIRAVDRTAKTFTSPVACYDTQQAALQAFSKAFHGRIKAEFRP